MTKETSKQAFQQILESGALGDSQKRVFQAIFELGDATGRELNDKLQSQSAHKRLSELEDMGLIRGIRARVCKVTGNDSTAWEITGSMPRAVTPVVNDTPTKAQIGAAVNQLRSLIAMYKAQGNMDYAVPEELYRVALWLKRKSR
jgi:DNA-binding Lrp family transcriptional regulator